jgi:hypothetical protein
MFTPISFSIYCGCGNVKQKSTKLCVKCAHVELRRSIRPPYDELMLDIQELGYSATGRKYGVSDNAIRKWCKSY